MDCGKGKIKVAWVEPDHQRRIMLQHWAEIPEDGFAEGICRLIGAKSLGCAPYSADGAEYCCWHDLDAALRDGPTVPTAIIPADFEGGLPIVLCGAIAFSSAGVDGRPASLGPGDCAEIMRQLLADQPRLKEYISRMEDFARRAGL